MVWLRGRESAIIFLIIFLHCSFIYRISSNSGVDRRQRRVSLADVDGGADQRYVLFLAYLAPVGILDSVGIRLASGRTGFGPRGCGIKSCPYGDGEKCEYKIFVEQIFSIV